LQVCGQGEWHTQKHGEKQHKRWQKLHIGVDTQGRIVASTVTESQEQDPSQVPALLAQVDREIDRFIGDGMYDQTPVYAAVLGHSPGASVLIPPRKDAVLSSQVAISPTQRDHHLLAIERAGRFAWKRTSDYYAQSHAEHAFSASSRSSVADCGRSEMRLRNGKPRWLARCSIGCETLGRPASYAVS